MAGLTQYLLHKVQRVHNASAPLVLCAPRHFPALANMTELYQSFKEPHWLPVKQRTIFKKYYSLYKALDALAPQYVSDLLVQYKPPRALRYSDKKLASSYFQT